MSSLKLHMEISPLTTLAKVHSTVNTFCISQHHTHHTDLHNMLLKQSPQN